MTLPTFNPPLPPSPGSSDKPEVRIRKAEFGDGYTQSTADGLNHVRRVLVLEWPVLEAAEADAIIAFFRTQGGYRTFLYTPPGESDPVKWTCEDWPKSYLGSSRYSVTATLRQSFVVAS